MKNKSNNSTDGVAATSSASKFAKLPAKFAKLPAILATASATAFCTLFCTGCIPQYYTPEFQNNVITEGTELIEEYLEANYSDYKITYVKMVPGTTPQQNVAMYGSTVACANVTIDDTLYTFYADTDNGNIYSNAQTHEIENYYWNEFAGELDCDYVLNYNSNSYLIEFGSRSVNTGAKLNAGVYEVTVTLDGVYPVSQSVEEIIKSISEADDEANITLYAYYCSDDYDAFSADDLKAFMDSHPEVLELSILNISRGDLDYFMNETLLRYKTPLGLKEEYDINRYSSTGDLTYEYICHTHEMLNEVAGVNYVSYILTMGNDDFSVIYEKTYDAPAEIDGEYIITHKTATEAPAYIFFAEYPGHSHANVGSDGTLTTTDYDIRQYRCGYYSLILKNNYEGTDDGYLIKGSEKILLVD